MIKKLLFGFLTASMLLTQTMPSLAEPQLISPKKEIFKTRYIELTHVDLNSRDPEQDDSKKRPDFKYEQANLRLGLSIRPKLDFITELTYSRVKEGPGNYIAGLLGGLRWSPRDRTRARLNPYFQAELGNVLNDIYKTKKYNEDLNQDNIGLPIEFNVRFSSGVSYRFSDDFSLGVEACIDHISNAGLSHRNQGFSALGFMLGVKKEF